MIRASLRHRLFVVSMAAFVAVYGSITWTSLSIDVLPDLTRPTVVVITEGHGRAPEEVETLITLPLEQELMGLPGLERLRSTSGIGLSVLNLEFGWDADPYRSRQFVAEKIQIARERMPQGVQPIMAPPSSMMGQIQQIALSTEGGDLSPVDLRTLAEWTIRPRVMAIPGVAQVISIGGGLKQYQILVSAEKINARQITLAQLDETLLSMGQNTTGGYLESESQEILVRNIGAASSLEEIRKTVVGLHFGKPVFVEDIAEVREGFRIKRGDGSYQGHPAVVMTIQKQPGADTLAITRAVDHAVAELAPTLPQGVVVNTDVFKQSSFVENAIRGVMGKLQMGSILVFLVLLIFMANLRMSLITLTAIPLSFFVTFIVFKLFGLTVNTMTLGGLAIAVGELVDDSIVDVENIFRRLRENASATRPKPALSVVYEASSEIRSSIVLSTAIIAFVFFPLFNLSGLEGRLFIPLAVAYLSALGSSLLVSLSVTPVLSSLLLKGKSRTLHGDTKFVQWLKSLDQKILAKVLHHPRTVLGATGLLGLVSLCLIPFMGRDFLPQFNEGSVLVTVQSTPGVSLSESNRVGGLAERAIMEVPEVRSVSRRTGRAEQDEHAMGVHVSEIDVDLEPSSGRERSAILDDIRGRLNTIPGVSVSVGQPLSHLMDHVLSGVSAQIAIKIIGSDLEILRAKAAETYAAIKDIPGLVDLRVEQQALIPQLKIHIMREDAARFGMSSGEVTSLLESAFNGHIVGQVIEEQKFFDLFYRFDDESRATQEKMAQTVIKIMPDGRKVRLEEVADIYESHGPNEISREDGLRRIVVSANASGRDLGGLVDEIRSTISSQVRLPDGYLYSYEGQFEAQKSAVQRIIGLSFLALVAIVILLYSHFRSKMMVAQVMLTIPFAFIGGIVFLFLLEGTFTVASLVGFIALSGISSRNGIMMISHYLHLIRWEGESLTESMVVRGSLERLVPVLMTATVASLALLPLVFAKGQPGSEILHPVAVVIVGGLISSTLLDIVVTPTVFFNYAKGSIGRLMEKTKTDSVKETSHV